MDYRKLRREEIESFREIDRSEKVEEVYYYRAGKLELEKESYDIKGWNPAELDEYICRLYALHDGNGYIYGAFEGGKIAGVVSLDSKLFGTNKNYLKLDMLYISREYRGKGIGRNLVEQCKLKAGELGAQKLYISATPFRNTVDFYMGVGSRLTSELCSELFELEPLDIHLELDI